VTRLINCLLALGALLSACNRRNETIRALEADGCYVEYFDSGCAYVDLYGLWLDDLRSEKLTAMVTKLAKEDVCMLALRSCAEDEHLKIVARSLKLWGTRPHCYERYSPRPEGANEAKAFHPVSC